MKAENYRFKGSETDGFHRILRGAVIVALSGLSVGLTMLFYLCWTGRLAR